MSEQVVVYTDVGGEVRVVVPGWVETKNGRRKPTYDELSQVVPSNVAHTLRKITTNELPKNRLYRNAWDDSNPEETVGINLEKAKEIMHSRRRMEREAEMKPLDRKERNIRATNEELANIREQKKALLEKYDAFQIEIDAATTISELEQIELHYGSAIQVGSMLFPNAEIF